MARKRTEWLKLVLKSLIAAVVVVAAIRILGPGLTDVFKGKIFDLKLGVILAVAVGTFLGNLLADQIKALN